MRVQARVRCYYECGRRRADSACPKSAISGRLAWRSMPRRANPAPGRPRGLLTAVQHDIEDRQLGIRLEVRRRREQSDGKSASARRWNALQEPVLVVLGLALEIHLCDQDVDLSAHVEVNVRRANESQCGGIAARFDRFEAVPSLGICRKKGKSLEV